MKNRMDIYCVSVCTYDMLNLTKMVQVLGSLAEAVLSASDTMNRVFVWSRLYGGYCSAWDLFLGIGKNGGRNMKNFCRLLACCMAALLCLSSTAMASTITPSVTSVILPAGETASPLM